MTVIHFNDLSRGTIVDNEYSEQGVTISAYGGSDQAMIFDSANPTGNDHDLETSNLGKVLIISEDGDSNDPDDNWNGGTLRFTFDEETKVESLTFLDIEEGATVCFYDEQGNLISQQFVQTADNGQHVAQFNVEGAFRMDVYMHGSGAVDDLVFHSDSALDGYVDGTSGDDVIDANYENDPDGDRVDAGDALLPGEASQDDVILAGAGDDFVLAGAGDDEVYGGEGDDTLCGQDGDDVMYGGEGNDTIEGMKGNDLLFGQDGDDVIYGNQGTDVLVGDLGDDKLFGGAGDDVVHGGKGDDRILGGSGDDVAFGGAGADDIQGGTGNDVLIGGGRSFDGNIDFNNLDTGELVNGQFLGQGVHVSSADPHNPVMIFDTANPTGGDNDLATNNLGNVLILSEDRDGTDPDDNATGGTFVFEFDGPARVDSLDLLDVEGGAWIKLYDMNGDLINQVEVSPTGNNGQVHQAINTDGVVRMTVEINGSGAIDNLNFALDGEALDEGDVIDGQDGNDFIDGQAGDDVLRGGAGDDTVVGGADNDFLFGGTGQDTLAGGTGDDVLEGGAGADVIYGGDDSDVIKGGAGDVVDGGTGGNDHDILDLTGQGPFIIENETVDADEDSTSGTIVFVDGDGNPTGETLTFSEIEEIRGEQVQPNEGPNATDDVYSVSADEDSGDVDGNAITDNTGAGSDSDPDGPQSDLNVSEVNGDAANVGQVVAGDNGGQFTINADGSIDFDANGDFDDLGNGETDTTTVTYTITDADGATDTATVTFTVNGTNADPVACPDLYIVTENETGGDVDGNVITDPSDNNAGQDVDPDGDTLTVVGVNTPNGNVGAEVVGSNGGLFTINEDGSFDFSANDEFEALAPGETAETSVTYTVADGNGGTSTTTLTIQINGVNDAPDAVDSSYVVDQGEAFGDVDANAITDDTGAGADSDPENDPLTVVAVDGDAANVGGVVAGDNGGEFTINADGTVDFSANGDFDDLGDGETASTSVTYTIADPDGGEDTATVTFTVTGTNDGPVAVADGFDAGEDDPAGVVGNVLDNDSDPDSDPLTVGAVDGDPANVGQPVTGSDGGLVTINPDGTVTFDPNGDFNALGEGETTTTTVTYTVTDPSGQEATETVTITVTGTNDAPTAVADTDTTDPDTIITLDNVLGNDTDPENDPLTVAQVDGDAANVGQPVAGDNGGLITIGEDGAASFDPNGEFADLGDGETAETSVTYTITDENGATDTTTVTITVTGANDGPTAVADAAETDEDTPIDLDNVLGNDTDPEDDDLTVGAVDGDPANVGQPVAGDNGGLITIGEDGTASFDPNGDFEALAPGETAETTVSYTVVDENGAEDTTTVTVTVTGVNDAPNAVDSSYVFDQDEAFGDMDANAITDDTGAGADSDPENDPLTVVAVDGDAANVGGVVAGDNGGEFTINADGTVDFSANGDFDDLGDGETASTSVTYTIADPDGQEDTATVTFTVTGTNEGPVAVADDFAAGEDDPSDVVGNVLGNDTDPDNDPLTVSEVNGDPANVGQPIAGDNGGLITIGPDGEISFDPNGDFDDLTGGETTTTTVTYTITDPSGEESTTTATITVTGTNEGPDATDNTYVFLPNETAGDVDGNVITDDTGAGVDSDPEDDDLTVVAVDGDAANVGQPVAGDNGGLFTINPDGTVDFDANGEFDGLPLGTSEATSVTYTIVDENGEEDTATVTFTVDGINDGTVQGTDGNDVINPDIPYVDADGDIVDANDGILPGDEGTNNDVIEGLGGDDSIAGGLGSDDIFGGEGDDTIQGNEGNDVLFGGQGDDNVQGGVGDDLIDGGAGDDLLLGGDGDDTVRGGAGDDRVFGAEGDDELRGGSGDDTIEGSEGEDTLFGGSGDDDLWGGLDDDTVIGGAGNDTVAGEDGDDSLHGGLGDDILDGGDGDDEISDVEGSDTVFGGDGDDVINVGSTQGDELPDVGYPEQPSATIPGLVFPGYDADEDPDDDKDFVDGGAGNDIINTGDDDDSIIGGSGDDTINAGFDDDTIDGGTGNDFIEGAEGNDTVRGGDGDDTIYGGLANPLVDVVLFPDDEPDANGFQDLVPENNGDLLFGGAGNDTIFGQDDDDTLFGGDGDDVLDGGVDDDELIGGAGDDTLLGGQGDDRLIGGDGDDLVEGGTGDDTLLGIAGNDTLIGGEGADILNGNDGDEILVGDLEDGSLELPDDVDPDPTDNSDTIFGAGGNDTIFGGDDADTIFGGAGDDVIDGGVDDDYIRGGFGDDSILGGQGDDNISGNEGDDTINGGDGADKLAGGFGSDTFIGGNGGDMVVGGEDPDGSDIDVLDLTGVDFESITYTSDDREEGFVTYADGSTLTFAEIETVIPCFTPGTTIATPKGERLVEELKVGDRIITRDNGIQEIAWMGHKQMSGKTLQSSPHLQPVLIKAGALGHGLPERDMLVSPNHRVLVASEKTQLYFEESEVLAAAKHMAGADGIHQVEVLQTTYIHFMFERHEVVLSNGAWTESFQPGDYSLKGIGNSQRNEIFELFPELATQGGREGYQAARKSLKKHEAKLLLK